MQKLSTSKVRRDLDQALFSASRIAIASHVQMSTKVLRQNRPDRTSTMKKRKRTSNDGQTLSKRRCVPSKGPADHASRLRQYYSTVDSLGDYLQRALPLHSKLRRRRLVELCRSDTVLAKFLKTVLVASNQQKCVLPTSLPELHEDLQHFTQTQRGVESSAIDRRSATVLEVAIPKADE